MKTPIFFNEAKHKYTNEVGNEYISATTIIGKYEVKFDEKADKIARACERIGRNPRHPKYKKYKGKTASQIKAGWKREAERGCAIGNDKHDFLENSVKDSSDFHSVFGNKYQGSDNPNSKVRLYTIEDILDNPDSGKLNLDYFVKAGVKDRYPKIYKVIEAFVKEGWRVYSEVAVFHNGFLVSGLIDILLIKGNDFIILDWKTNKDDIRYEAGYWEKDNNGKSINYKITDEKLKYPLHKLNKSTGIKYDLQLSLYAVLVEYFGLNHVSNILCHIRRENYNSLDNEPELIGKNKVEITYRKYLKNDVMNMLFDYEDGRTGQQVKLF
jgi:ATP-dependent exoDNAse (exonuclease V) beta subunit